MTITLSGLASGLDTQSIISSLMKVEQIPLDQINARKTIVGSAKDAMSSFLSKVTSLRTAASNLAEPQSYRSLTASSSATGVTASVSGAASPGSYSVRVVSLAHEQRTQGTGMSSNTGALAQAGTLTMTVGSGGTPASVTIGEGDSLATIANNINNSGARVVASVLYDGSMYHLSVRGLDSGQSNVITFSESGTSLGLDSTLHPENTYQAATDAHIVLDEHDDGQGGKVGLDVYRSTNVVQGVIAGVTLSLTQKTDASASPAVVTINSDPQGLADKINTFVKAYNDVVSSAHFTAGYGTLKAQVTMLQGDSAVRSTLDQLSRAVTSVVAGTSGRYTTLGSAGLAVTKDGSMQLDQVKFKAALADDPTAVARLFTTDTSMGATGVMGALDTLLDGLTVGTGSLLQGRVDALGKQASKLQDDADALQIRLDITQKTLQAQFTQLEMAMGNMKALGAAYNALSGYTNPFDSTNNTSSG